ncbi:fibronectin type III domain-containing protein [Acidovorax sp. A1169]|uniref:RCC1 domain-containing protein n=1 Tax=Acidovorax sp. A1169 TaxID=3059524 RepID=UPI0027378C2E|nr:fibronectin type III domain-containing protein [Acidovorax sp. A1169]MDP4074428.1 fibronectin type III domain-containing protein [Acidovorax sp. A1169]
MFSPSNFAAQRRNRLSPFSIWYQWSGVLLLAWLAAVLPAHAQAPVPASVLGQPVQQVVSGTFHTCAVTTAGAVQCWGNNAFGQLGDGTNTDQATPQPVTGLGSGVVAIAAGQVHTCALTTAGAVQCWGANVHGQLGDSSTTNKSAPQPVTGLASGVAAIAAGEFHTCALTTAGAVQCWGRNLFGQLGDGTTTSKSTPQPVAGMASGVAAISGGTVHTCALTTAGAVHCWGTNNEGQLGDGSTTNKSTPQPVTGLASGVAAIAAGGYHTCALTTAGATQCWGSNAYGQLGNGNITSKTTPQPVIGLANGVAAIAAGENYTCAQSIAGAVQCWGYNDLGQLGDGSITAKSTPQPVTGLANGVAAIAAGETHTCALTTAGAVQCWGFNDYGQLGDGSTISKTTPQPVVVLASGVAAIIAKGSHTCALTTAGAVHCWGYNVFGELGDGTTTSRMTPQPVAGLVGGMAAIAAGSNHSCVLNLAGAVQCWGRNTLGQLGDGSTTDKGTPQPVTGLASGVAAIAGGYQHTCALTTAGAVKCWGDNIYGQVGDGSQLTRLTPQTVLGLTTGVAAIAAGDNHTCALTTTGAVQCWGQNGQGQLGDGSTLRKLVPQPIPGLVNGVAAIAAGESHTCALTTAGGVQCWGGNGYGQLGDGSTTDATSPQAVAGLATGAAAIAAGKEHTCALTTTGAMQCWGYNRFGQLGNGSTTSKTTPQPVTGLASGVAAIGTGYGHTCALITAGAVQCWGYNGMGQLGNGGVSDRNVPTHIAAAQAIDFPVAVGSPASGASITLAATASSGLAVAFDTFTPDVCTVSGNTLTVLPGKTGYLCGVLARQAGGVGSDAAYFAAAPSQSRLLRVAGVPGAPTAVTASAGNAQATVAWTAPASNGGSTITAYTVVAVADATKTCAVTTGSPLPTTCTVAGLANGTPYTFTVKAANAAGDSLPSPASAPVTPTAPVVVAPPAEDPGPTSTTINTPGSTTTITNPSLPVVVGPGAGGGTIVLPGTGTTPVTLHVTINGQPLTVQALPGTQLRIAEVNGQSVLVLVVLEGWASMTSSAVGQPMVLAGQVLLSSGSAGTTVEAQPLAVAVQVGSLTAPAGSLPAVGSTGLQAGERLQVNDQGAVVAITLGSLKGDTNQPGDSMAFANLPASIAVDNKAFARLNGPLARLSGANMAQGLEMAPSGVFLVRDGGQVFQLLPTLPITIDTRLPDGVGFTPLGLLRWVRGGVVVQFAPAVADLAGLAQAVTAALPDATLKLGAEGVLQLRTGGQTYVLRPDWTGGGATSTGTPQIGVDEQGRIYLKTGQGARQLLLPALLNATQASSIFTTALPGAVLAVQPGSSDGALTLTLAGQAWRLVPQWVLPTGSAAQVPPQAGPWWMGSDGLLYLKLGTQVQGVRISD